MEQQGKSSSRLNEISLREYVDLISADMRRYFELRIGEVERRIGSERTLLVTANQDRQAELERRLTALNELRNEVLQDRNLFVTKDAFDIVSQKVAESISRDYYETQRQSLEKQASANALAIANMRSRSAAYTAAIGIAVTVLMAVILIVQFAGAH